MLSNRGESPYWRSHGASGMDERAEPQVRTHQDPSLVMSGSPDPIKTIIKPNLSFSSLQRVHAFAGGLSTPGGPQKPNSRWHDPEGEPKTNVGATQLGLIRVRGLDGPWGLRLEAERREAGGRPAV